MKIGELARRSKLNITTIRYYIKKGLLVPQKNDSEAQFDFSEEDLEILQDITEWKEMGFSINEIHRAISIRRNSNWVEPEYIDDYKQLLYQKEEALIQNATLIDQQLLNVKQKIHKLNSMKMPKNRIIGVPLKAMEFFACPICGQGFQYTNIEMNNSYIQKGDLSCSCGYQAHIKEGVLHTEQQKISMYDKPDLNRNMYRTMSNELVAKLQESYHWFLQRIHTKKDTTVIMETHLNCFFFLYKFLDDLDENCFLIVSDKFEEIILMYKSYIEKLKKVPNILFVVNNDHVLPLENHIVDYFIDHSSTNENYIYSHQFLLDQVARYLKTEGTVLSTYFSFLSESQSLKNLNAGYPENHPDNYTSNLFLKAYKKNYRLKEKKQIGSVKDSGEGITFIWHEKGESLYIDCYELIKT